MTDDPLVHQAAQMVASASALLIGAGAGMGVDSGLPDFRGNQGFWQAYPPYASRGLSFSSLANPQWFTSNPAFAWGFYGHRLNLYRRTQPHDGFRILQAWARRMSHGAFVYTSNVDGQFQRAGFDRERILEVHGAIDWMQCTRNCGIGLFSADSFQVAVDEATMLAREPLPSCPSCGALARPNILMFGDPDWDYSRAYPQEVRLNDWLQAIHHSQLVVIECGAGMALPTVRRLSERVAQTHHAMLIRINPREPSVPQGHIGLRMSALEGLRAIQEQLAKPGK
jgi:NAD-dependent SIR2 family protein deacetylase